jgi:hypothetical protein
VRISRLVVGVLAILALSWPAAAQQRPLLTEDPEPIGAGRLLIEGGVAFERSQTYPASGLEGNLWKTPIIGLSIGISSIAELQIDGGPYDHLSIRKRRTAPLSDLLTVTGSGTHDVEDIVVGTKIRLLAEAARHPAIGLRLATRLPNASNESGMGLDTTYFYASLLGAKTVQSIRIVGNLGLGILSDPTEGHRQNDALTYGASMARAVTDHSELVGELNGRLSRKGVPYPGTESRSVLNLGGRYTRGSVRFDAGVLVGLTSVDPTVGFAVGFTYVVNAFQVP